MFAENVPFVSDQYALASWAAAELHLLDNAVAVGHTVAPLQRSGNDVLMLCAELPEVHGTGVLPFAGVGTSKTYRSCGFWPLVSIRAMPVEAVAGQSVPSSCSKSRTRAQAVASGRWAWIMTCSLYGYL